MIITGFTELRVFGCDFHSQTQNLKYFRPLSDVNTNDCYSDFHLRGSTGIFVSMVDNNNLLQRANSKHYERQEKISIRMSKRQRVYALPYFFTTCSLLTSLNVINRQGKSSTSKRRSSHTLWHSLSNFAALRGVRSAAFVVSGPVTECRGFNLRIFVP